MNMLRAMVGELAVTPFGLAGGKWALHLSNRRLTIKEGALI